MRYSDFPLPVFASSVLAPAAITYQAVEEFVFSPLRRGAASKSRKEILRAEILRWHPDKFLGSGTVLSTVHLNDQEDLKQAAVAIGQHLTVMMSTK